LLAMCNEATFGLHRIEVLILLYRTVFIPTVIYNSQAWSHIDDKDIANLKTIQLRCLKRILRTSTSTPNSFIFLELGVLPIKYEIQIKQFMYLHHILKLPEDDPVRRVYKQQLAYPAEENWANNTNKMRMEYNFPEEEVLSAMTRYTWKTKVKKTITESVRKLLIEKCKSMSKTGSLQYNDLFKLQEYFLSYPFDVANVIFKLRGRSTNCLENRGQKKNCRLCGSGLETQNHGLNCPIVARGAEPMSMKLLFGDVPSKDKDVMEIVTRFNRFEEALK